MRICVIPARGGSKRIPDKNIRLFHGRPMIAHAIGKAQASGLFDDIVVSTDSERIAEVAIREGARIPFMRPEHLSNDHVGTQMVMQHAVEHYRVLHGESLRWVCCLYATCPLLDPQDLVAGAKAIETSPFRFAFSVTTFPFPIQRALWRNEHGVMTPAYPEHAETRSQDLQVGWQDAGQFYWGRPRAFADALPIYSEDKYSVGVPVPRWRVQDIDTIEDWERAETMYETIRRRGEGL